MHIFAELADNEPRSCIAVVALNSLKGGHLGVIRLLLSEFAGDREKGGTDCPISVSWHLKNPLRQLGGDDV